MTRKYVLKRALENVLPKDVVWRKKAGFGAPIRSWLRGPLRPLVDDLLSEETVNRRRLFRPLAFTKTFAVLAATVIAVTLVPVLILLAFAERAPSATIINVTLAVFMGIGMALMSTFFIIERGMQPVGMDQ